MDHPKSEKHHHHVLPVKLGLMIGAGLLILTAITVWSAGFDLGWANFPLAMLIATTKATMVALIFMNLKYDRKENAVIFATSFLFLAIFISFTATDIFFRGDVAVKGPLLAAGQQKSTVKQAWISTPELVTRGKELFAQQCVSCHGDQGRGDGPAAASLTPRPRNFTEGAGWKNGRKPSEVFKTLKEGIPGSSMASYATLPSDDRWALAHYVLTLGPKPPADSTADLAKVGIDPSKDTGGAEEKAKEIPVDVAMKLLVEEAGNHGARAE
jgi:caa(3)-type oxidase subunit IV